MAAVSVSLETGSTQGSCTAQEQSTAGLQPRTHTSFSQSSYSFVSTAIIHTRRTNSQHKSAVTSVSRTQQKGEPPTLPSSWWKLEKVQDTNAEFF